MSTVRAALHRGATQLEQAGIDTPRREARLLLAHALGVTVETLLRDADTVFEPASYNALLTRRIGHEPLALITGHREFWSLNLAVSGATLIPRPDSETLIEAALAAIPDRARVHRVLDLGTGTGCLLLAALREYPASFGIGTDRSAAACLLARSNAAMLSVDNRTAVICADWAAPLAGRFELILCNPPYIATGDLPGLMPEVVQFEPASALDGGADGLSAYRRILPDLPRLLAPDGVAILELGLGQAAAVSALAEVVGLLARTRADLAGIPRALLLSNPAAP